MTVKEKIDQDLKVAMLSSNKSLVSTLRGLKSAILYEEVAKGLREEGLPESEVISVLAKEAKKRQESADLYGQGGNKERADAELAEKTVIENYLPSQLSDDELFAIVDDVIKQLGVTDMKSMGGIISAVKQRIEGAADGSRIAAAVKGRLAT